MIDFIDSKILAQYSWEFIQFVLLQPQSLYEFYGSLFLGLLAVILCLSQVHSMGSAGGSLFAALIVGLISLFALVEITALTRIFVCPMIGNENYHQPAQFVALAVALLLMITPFTRTLFRSSYGNSLAAWVIALLVAGMLVYGCHVVIRPRSGDKAPQFKDILQSGLDLQHDLQNKLK